jgi:predicted metal-binding membrane protein
VRHVTTYGVALAATLGPAALCWVIGVHQMSGMDMGAQTRLGSFAFFFSTWVVMMAAMMLPGAAPAVVRNVDASGRLLSVPLFLGSYLAVWALFGLSVYALYRPHSTAVAGAVTVAAGTYELTPWKGGFRRRCREGSRSGVGFGLCCVGSSIGLMLMLVVVGVMSITWMSVVALLVLAQKLLPARRALDASIAVGLVAVGVLIVTAPSAVPAITPM